MSEIELLELEIAERKARLKELKEQKNPRFKLNLLDEAIGLCDVCRLDYIKGPLRNAIKMMATAQLYNGMIRTALKLPHIEELGFEKVKICNDFIQEIAPVFAKYIAIFVEINKEEKSQC